MWRRCGLILAMTLAAAVGALSETTPKVGLLWQNTGLPAVFPLIVKTNPGADYYLRLHAVDTDEAKLAAYAVGGSFFKVLVPPGTYNLRVASGTDWQGETDLFGPDTHWIDVPGPLTFEVRDHSTKSGHMIDLRDQEGAPVVEARFICQRHRLIGFPRPLPPYEEEGAFGARLTEPGVLLRYPGSFFDPSRRANADRPVIPTEFAPYFSNPYFDIRARLC